MSTALIHSRAQSGVDAPPVHEPARPGELARSALATGLARQELGWEPLTDLPSGALATLDWFRAKRA